MNHQHKADDTRNRAQKQNSHFRTCISFAVAVTVLFMIGCAANSRLADRTDVPVDQAGRSMQQAAEVQQPNIESNNAKSPAENNSQAPSSIGSEPDSDAEFPTFKSTEIEICTNDEGHPLIYLFSSSLCAHCQWGGGIYDFIVKYYTANGLIEAHHYDLISGDDLLTEEIETEIPADRLEIYRSGSPKDLVPYYNFGCKYDRVGNGYEKENGIEAEGEEMRRVIEALVKSVSE